MKYCWETSALRWSCPISPELKGDLWGCCGGSNSSNFLLQGLRFYWVLCKGKWKISMYVLNSTFLKCATMELKLSIAFGVWLVKKSQIFHHVLAVKYSKVIVWIKILISNINEYLYICLLKLKLDINVKKKKKRNFLSTLSSPSLMVTRNVNSTLGTVCPGGVTHHIPALQTLPTALPTPHCLVFPQGCNHLSEFGAFLPCLGLRLLLVCPSCPTSWPASGSAPFPGQGAGSGTGWGRAQPSVGRREGGTCGRNGAGWPGTDLPFSTPVRWHSCSSWWHLPTCHSFFLS